MKEKLDFKAGDTKMKALLQSKSEILKIPPYQRPYSWKEEQINDFWNDINTDEQSFFLGSIILNKEEEKNGYIEVIDGQQRLLTTTMFLAAIRNIFLEMKEDHLADTLQRNYIAFRDDYGNDTFKIQTADKTAKYYQEYIQTAGCDVEASKTNSKEEARIKKNFLKLKDKIVSELSTIDANDAKIKRLHELRERVGDLVIIEMEIFSDEVAYEIFETVNARGADLTVADLLKNLIFKKIKNKDQKEIAKKLWSEIETNIEATGSELKKFIRYYWIGKYKFVTEKKLYVDIKNTIKDWLLFIKDLHHSSIWYNIMIEGTDKDFLELKHGNMIHRSIFAIRLMNVSQCFTLLLPLLSQHSKIVIDFSKIVKHIELFTFKYSAVCKMPGNSVEKLYSKYSINISKEIEYNSMNKKKLDKNLQRLFSQLTTELQELSPIRPVFIEEFEKIKYRNSEATRRLLKYILEEFNDDLTTGETRIDFDKVNLEHVLPQNPTKWNLTKEDVVDYVNCLGNLCLLHKGKNSGIGNDPIKKKIPILLESEIKSTMKFANKIKENDYNWNEDLIYNRQNEMAQLAFDKIWKY